MLGTYTSVAPMRRCHHRSVFPAGWGTTWQPVSVRFEKGPGRRRLNESGLHFYPEPRSPDALSSRRAAVLCIGLPLIWQAIGAYLL